MVTLLANPIFNRPTLMHQLRRLVLLLTVGMAFPMAGCAGHCLTVTTPNGSRLELPADGSALEFAAGTVIIRSRTGAVHQLRGEIAQTQRQRERGLMYRTAMPEESGMLFVYPEEQGQTVGFWMYNTHIPLSLAYAGNDGVIFQITDMVPCPSPDATICARDNYPARKPFRYGLEVNLGYFERRGIGVGDRIEYVWE